MTYLQYEMIELDGRRHVLDRVGLSVPKPNHLVRPEKHTPWLVTYLQYEMIELDGRRHVLDRVGPSVQKTTTRSALKTHLLDHDLVRLITTSSFIKPMHLEITLVEGLRPYY